MTGFDDGAETRRTVLRRGAIASGILLGGSGVGTVGATPGGGNKGGRCDVRVPRDHATIQGAVDAANPGDTICVAKGTYDEKVTVDRRVTVRGQAAPTSNAAAHVDGQVTVKAGGAGATITRLRISPSDTFLGGTFPDPAGVLVKASDVTVEGNVIEGFRADLSNGEGSFAMHGVQVFGGSSGVTVRDNQIRNFESVGGESWPKYGGLAGVKLQANVAGATVERNDVTDLHSAGWVYGVVLTPSGSASGVPSDATVRENHLERLNDGSRFDVFDGGNDGRDGAPYPGSAVGIDGAGAREATLTRNNLLAPNGVESKDQSHALDATCNWWGDRDGPTHPGSDGDGTWALERGSATVEYTPWLVAPAPSNACVGGSDRGNGGGDGNGNSNGNSKGTGKN